MLAVFGGTHLQDQAQTLLREVVPNIVGGTVFLLGGLGTWGIAAMRRHSGVRVLVWLGMWSVMYGTRLLIGMPALGDRPNWLQESFRYLDTFIVYLILAVAITTWLPLTTGKVHFLLQVMICMALAIGLAGIVIFLVTGSSDKLLSYYDFLAACSLIVLIVVAGVPRLARKFLLTPYSRVLIVGTLIFALEAFYANLARPLGYPYRYLNIWDSLGFAALLFSFGYVALQMVFANERRLVTIEGELAVAREIQTSILPSGSPAVKNLLVTATYRPMTEVAGDFYDFIIVDEHRVGVLLVDVSGHGVPAALIAAMIKMAVQSLMDSARDPREVLGGLNRMLSRQPHNRLATAAYLFFDTKNYRAIYSGAGHPPLLRCRENHVERIENNGLILGVVPETDYPVCDIPIHPGDRFVLYTDGVVEPENASGDSFGDHKLEQVVRTNQSHPAPHLIDQLLCEIRQWQPASIAQQDDITLIVVDVT